MLGVSSSFASEVIFLENNKGMIENAKGKVVVWENQVDGQGDAIQNDPSLGGEMQHETYSGKVNVAFQTDNAHLVLDGSSKHFEDGSYTIAYVGYVGKVDRLASLLGNLRVNRADSSQWSGFRFVRKPDGGLFLQFASPGFRQTRLSDMKAKEFFYFGFSIKPNGVYRYFDNSSPDVIRGKISGDLIPSKEDAVFNLAFYKNTKKSHDPTEVVELKVFDYALDADAMKSLNMKLASSYPEVEEWSFRVASATPASTARRVLIKDGEEIGLNFSELAGVIDPFPTVTLNKRDTIPVNWNSRDSGIYFSFDDRHPPLSLVKVSYEKGLYSATGQAANTTARSEYNFITRPKNLYGFDEIEIDSIATVENGKHNLPLLLTLPNNRKNKVPVHIWVHGGAWSGGTPAESVANVGPFSKYLADKLGIATLGIAYRTKGSNGTFSKAMEDIETAVQWAHDNAEKYHFDMDRIIFSGGSAGSPLAALAAQRTAGTQALIGLNGIYDFVNNKQGDFGNGTVYQQHIPSLEENSAIFQLKDSPPATLLLHGTKDTTIDFTQSINFAKAIRQAKGTAKLVRYPGQPHAFFNAGNAMHEDVLYEMLHFLIEHGLTQ